MRTYLFIVFAYILFFCLAGFSQGLNEKPNNKFFSKIIIEEGDSVFIETDSLFVDSLIIRDGGSLNFLYSKSCLAVSHAFIGMNCHMNSFGTVGKNGHPLFVHGERGKDGRDLTVSIRFEELGSLYVNTSGGDGGYGLDGEKGLDGSPGHNEQKGGEGGSGGNGGDGGNAGNLNFFYLSPRFIVVFHEDRINSVHFNCSPGKGGIAGKGGRNGVRADIAQKGAFTTLPNEKQSGGPRGRDGIKGKNGSGGSLHFQKTEL